MINNKRVLCIIPARGGSKGLPGKNIRQLNGKPLLGWSIQAAIGSLHVDKIIVSTEDPLIAKHALEQGADVPFMRPNELATDTATTASVIEHALDSFKEHEEFFDYILTLQPTCPLTESTDIDQSLKILESKQENADAIVSVGRVESMHHSLTVTINDQGYIKPYAASDFSHASRRQELSELYFFDGSLYLSKVHTFYKEKSFFHKRTLPYIVPKWKTFDIDDLIDFLCIETILKNIDQIKLSFK